MFTYLEKKNKPMQFFNLNRASLWGNIRAGLENLIKAWDNLCLLDWIRQLDYLADDTYETFA